MCHNEYRQLGSAILGVGSPDRPFQQADVSALLRYGGRGDCVPARMKSAPACEAGALHGQSGNAACWAATQSEQDRSRGFVPCGRRYSPHLDIDNCDTALIALYGESELTHR